ncbi:unnamed protein product [Agarophyton chilense]
MSDMNLRKRLMKLYEQAVMPYERAQKMNNAMFGEDAKEAMDLSKKQYDSVRLKIKNSVIDIFIEGVYAKLAEDTAHPYFRSLECVEYLEQYEHRISSLHYIRECQKLCPAEGFDKFSTRDIHACMDIPNAELVETRTWENPLSLGPFGSDQFQQVSGAQTKYRGKASDEEPEVERILQTVSEFGIEIYELHKQQRVLIDETRKMKEALAAKKKTSALLLSQKPTLKEENERMATRLVSSPDRVKGEIDNMRDSLDTGNEHIASLERKRRSLKHLAEQLKGARALEEEAIRATEEEFSNWKKFQELEDKKHKCEAKDGQFEEKVVSIEENREQVERWLDTPELRNRSFQGLESLGG